MQREDGDTITIPMDVGTDTESEAFNPAELHRSSTCAPSIAASCPWRMQTTERPGTIPIGRGADLPCPVATPKTPPLRNGITGKTTDVTGTPAKILIAQ